MSALLSNPEGLGEWRQRLFALEEEVFMTEEQYQEIWPYVDNVWRKHETKKDAADKRGFRDVYRCRVARKIKLTDKKPGLAYRNRTVNSNPIYCTAQMKHLILQDGRHYFVLRN